MDKEDRKKFRKIKRFVQFIGTFLLFAGIFYLISAFIGDSFNPLDWKTSGKILFLLLNFIILGFSNLIIYES